MFGLFIYSFSRLFVSLLVVCWLSVSVCLSACLLVVWFIASSFQLCIHSFVFFHCIVAVLAPAAAVAAVAVVVVAVVPVVVAVVAVFVCLLHFCCCCRSNVFR